MAKLKLTFACGPYDRMESLRTGAVQVEGVDLNYLEMDKPREIFDRMAGRQEFDAAEFSASEFITATGQGDNRFVAIPAFPSKAFRHGFVCVNRGKGIKTPKELAGRRVGVPLYTQTASIWIRGSLAEDHGVDLSSIRWVQGAVEKPGTHGQPHAPPLLKPVEIEQNRSDKSLSELLAAGEIDALIGSRLPDSLFSHPDAVARLWPDYRAVEKDYYRRTRIHPIMHLVVIRRDVYEADPWVASSLYKALCEAKDRAVAAMKFTAAQKYMLPFLNADIDEIEELFDGDPWPYGIERNRPTLEAFVRHLVDQHFIPKPIPIEQLFVPVYDFAGDR